MGEGSDAASPPASHDWTAVVAGPFADELRETLRTLPLHALQKYPRPRAAGLPFGHELRVAGRYLRGESSLLDASGFSAFYQALATPAERLLYRALILGEPLAAADWEDLLGRRAVDLWRAHALLEERAGLLACPFRVIALAGRLFAVDPLEGSFPDRVHIGQDSLSLVEHLGTQTLAARDGYLDVGTGSGVVLLTTQREGERAVGVDVNPRAVRAARFNAALNDAVCEVREEDVFQAAPQPFGLVTWNLPFVFMPEEDKGHNLDGYGGHLGIELTLRFFEILPRLLGDDGQAVLMSSAPILDGGSNELERELAERGARAGLDTTLLVLQAFWTPSLWQFQRRHGVRRFESVILHVRHGSGALKHVRPPLGRRLVDALRERAFYALYES